MATYLTVNGMRLGFEDDGSITVNGRQGVVAVLSSGFIQVSYVFFRAVKPNRVVGVRNRRKALNASYRKYRFSIILNRE